jgi:AbrB family looped-hinge helix DNA binding protein
MTLFGERTKELMALLKLRRAAQITLPAELRRQFNLSEGDYLEAEAVKDGILLRPVSIIEREKARKELIAVLDRVHAKQRPSTKSPKEEEEWIAQEIKAMRKEHAKRADRRR